MLSRRAFVGASAALAALATSSVRALNPPNHRTPAAPPSLVLFDRTFREGVAFGAQAEHRGARVVSVDADLGGYWMNTLEPLLKRGPLTLAGLTAGAPLFCLELLCRDYGLSTVYRIEHRLAPHDSVEHLLAGDIALTLWTRRLAAAGERWPAKAAELATAGTAAPRSSTAIDLLDLRAHEHSAHSLFTWMIAARTSIS
jgi:hypothetical protein